MGIDGAVFGRKTLDICVANHFALEVLCFYTPEFSVLWRPFIVTASLDKSEILYIVYSVIVFGYLAIPLCGELLRQTIEKVNLFGKEFLYVKSWRF